MEEKIVYSVGKTKCHGVLYYDPSIKGKRPAVVVAHAWMGQDAFARQKARDLAALGYVGFAADLFGNGLCVNTPEEAQKLIQPLLKERQLLRDRIVGAYEAIRSHPSVDPNRMGAIGFCFGGITAIELLRSGANLRGVVSFHGVLSDANATTVPLAKRLHGSLLMLQGHDDPMVSQADLNHFQKQMTEAGVDWQLHIYGHAQHGFTNPAAADVQRGIIYNSKANERSWQSMRNFFEEVFA